MAWLWTLKSFVDRGEDIIARWYFGQARAVQASFKVKMAYLLSSERHLWVRPRYHPLTGAGKGLGEVRLFAANVQHRPIGFIDIDRMEFTILICAAEKGGNFEPRDACGIAQRRRALVEGDRRNACGCTWL